MHWGRKIVCYTFFNNLQLTPKRAVKQQHIALLITNDECAIKKGEQIRRRAKRKRMREICFGVEWWEGSEVPQKAQVSSPAINLIILERC